ncbi:hypothetical protein C0J52_11684 [Blattella germanica]|nr:hypothetical protein C0J52_11684 [Blattella germanica]
MLNMQLVFETTDPLLKEAYQKLVLPEKNHPAVNEIGLRRVCEERKFAYFMLNLFEKQVGPSLRLSCSVVDIPKTFFPATLAITCTKNSTLRRLFNYYLNILLCSIVKMYEGGLLKINEARLVPLKGQTKMEEVTIVADMEKMMMVFIVFIVGVLSSVIILVVEICTEKIKHFQLKCCTVKE